jgi:hypothetical protein
MVQPAAPTGGGGLFKILLIVLVCVVGLVVLAGAGVWYAAHRIEGRRGETSR